MRSAPAADAPRHRGGDDHDKRRYKRKSFLSELFD